MESAMQNSSTASEMVVAQLKRDIFTGELPPAAKLKVKDLAARYDVGATSIREALSHLAAAGIINQHPQRGFRVPKLDAESCLDLMKTREIVEVEAFRLSLEYADTAWEDAIVSSYSLLLKEIERIYDRQTPTIASYFERHNQFHRALLSACPVRLLLVFVDSVYQRLAMYRRITYTDGFPKEYVIEQHHGLMQAALNREPDVAIAAMREHIRANSQIVTSLLNKPKAGSL